MKNEAVKAVAEVAAATVTAPSYFSRKIGNTTFVVSVSFNEKATGSIEDKILRLVTSEIQQVEVQKCG